MGNEHISFTTSKIGSLVDVQSSKDPEGLRIFYYLVQNDDEDMIYMYNAYLHKLITCFLSQPLARDKVKEIKEKAMTMLSPYSISGQHDFMHDNMGSVLSSETGGHH